MDLFKGKKVMYVHGFASSGQSGTVTRIREVLTEAEVIAPDLPIHPEEAMALLYKICETEKPDLIIGTSMGGMYAEMLHGYDRILVNPAMQMGDTMKEHGMIGAQHFQNPRQDGVQDFIVTKALVKEYKDITEKCFADTSDAEQQHQVDATEIFLNIRILLHVGIQQEDHGDRDETHTQALRAEQLHPFDTPHRYLAQRARRHSYGSMHLFVVITQASEIPLQYGTDEHVQQQERQTAHKGSDHKI